MFKSKHILILEDDPERIKKFKMKLIGNVVEIVDKTDAAIALLQHKKWDCLFLDHDLDGKVYVPSGDGTGYEVAVWLTRNPERIPETVILHSYNDTGRSNMKFVLSCAIEMPGAWLSEEEE